MLLCVSLMEQQVERDPLSGQGAGSYPPDMQSLSLDLVSGITEISSAPRQSKTDNCSLISLLPALDSQLSRSLPTPVLNKHYLSSSYTKLA